MSMITDLTAKLTSLKTFRDSIRTKLVSMGIGTNTDNLETCKTNIQNIVDYTKKTSTSTAVSYPYYTGSGGSVYGKGNAGYCSTETMVKIPVTNLTPGNIKKGVNIGGVIGTLEPMPDEMSYTVDGMVPSQDLEYSVPNSLAAYLSSGLCVPVYSKNTSYIGGIWALGVNTSKNILSRTTTRYITRMSNTYAIVQHRDGNNGSTDFSYTTDGGVTWNSVNQQGLYESPRVVSNGATYILIGKTTFGSQIPTKYYKSTTGATWVEITPTAPSMEGGVSMSYDPVGDPMSGYYYRFISKHEYYSSTRHTPKIYVYRSTDLVTWSLAYSNIDLGGYHTSDEHTHGYRFFKSGNLLVLSTSGWWEYTMVSSDNGVSWRRLSYNNHVVVEYKGRLYTWSSNAPKVINIISSSGLSSMTLTSTSTPVGIGCLPNKFVVLYPSRYDIMNDVY